MVVATAAEESSLLDGDTWLTRSLPANHPSWGRDRHAVTGLRIPVDGRCVHGTSSLSEERETMTHLRLSDRERQ